MDLLRCYIRLCKICAWTPGVTSAEALENSAVGCEDNKFCATVSEGWIPQEQLALKRIADIIFFSWTGFH